MKRKIRIPLRDDICTCKHKRLYHVTGGNNGGCQFTSDGSDNFECGCQNFVLSSKKSQVTKTPTKTKTSVKTHDNARKQRITLKHKPITAVDSVSFVPLTLTQEKVLEAWGMGDKSEAVNHPPDLYHHIAEIVGITREQAKMTIFCFQFNSELRNK